MCAPCSNDDDCPQGICISAPFSSEKFCSVTSKTPCVLVDDALQATCPKAAASAPYRITCQTTDDEDLPRNQCLGVVQFRFPKQCKLLDAPTITSLV